MSEPDGAPLSQNGFVPYEAMAPAEANRLGEMVRRAERTQPTPSEIARRELMRRYPVRYGISEHPLPHGAVAMLVLDRESAWPRSIVLSTSATDGSLALADAAMKREAGSLVGSAGPRVLFVKSDQHVITPTGEAVAGRALYLHQPHAESRLLVQRLVASAAAGAVERLEGVEVRFAQ
jgi:hypothetical protein